MKIGKNFKKVIPLYKLFSKDWAHLLDYSDTALQEAYILETYGKTELTIDENLNGFIQGKKWMNVQIASWNEDLVKGYLFRQELYDDPNYPNWWLDKVLIPKY